MTTVRYFPLPLPQDFSSIPIIAQALAAGPGGPAASPATRAAMPASASHVIRSSAAALVQGICAASQAE